MILFDIVQKNHIISDKKFNKTAQVLYSLK